MTRLNGQGAALAVALFLCLMGDNAAASEESEETFGLPEDTGREEVLAFCGPCHSMRLVTQQGLSRADWDELLVWMIEEQEMPPLEAQERKLVLDYLAKHLGPDTHRQRLRAKGIIR
ncbi:MAG: hypothetical protein ACR2OX_08115 [Methyloligellaceae bacterium]